MSNGKSKTVPIRLHVSPVSDALANRGALGDDNAVKDVTAIAPVVLNGRARPGDELGFRVAFDASDPTHEGLLGTPIGHALAAVLDIGGHGTRYSTVFKRAELFPADPGGVHQLAVTLDLVGDPTVLPEDETITDDPDPAGTEGD